MANSWVEYEWDVETVCIRSTECDDPGDVIDHNHFPTYKECVEFANRGTGDESSKFVIVLVCDDANGRSWAYMDNGKLPEWSQCAYGHDCRKIPQRFHREVASL